ncbi:muconolactone Delta-isomerase family protein [Nonomuraea sp. B5E05]|uniref:muconolactone Delta-isomerase family protein n=1 Tax=Nonomuraea sp. B5E05 TaxID=3153569 RepID=UPI0032600369
MRPVPMPDHTRSCVRFYWWARTSPPRRQESHGGLYEAGDPAELHDALASLPMWKWMDVTVEALATHPQEQKESRGSGK